MQRLFFRTRVHLPSLGLLLISYSAVAQGSLVLNGDFEAGSTAWTLIQGAHIVLAPSRPGFAASLTSGVPAAEPTASQSISGFIVGQVYLVSGDYKPEKDRGGNPPTNPSLGVAFDGVYVLQITSSPVGDWQSFSFSYTPTSSSALFSVSSQINGTGVEYTIDNIAIQLIPEPSALALLSLGVLPFASRFIRRARQESSRH